MYQFITGHYNDDRSISVYARDEKGIKHTLKVVGFEPYFYIPPGAIPRDERFLEVKRGYRTIYGENVWRVNVLHPGDVPELRAMVPKHYEATEKFIRRFLVDTGIRGGFDIIGGTTNKIYYTDIMPTDFSCPPLRCYLDIEVYSRARFPNPYYANEMVVLATVWDDKYKKYLSVLVDNKEGREELSENHVLVRVKTEVRLLSLLKQYLNKLDPDIPVCWNVDFDLEYLVQRGRKFKIFFNFRRSCPFDIMKAYGILYKPLGLTLEETLYNETISVEGKEITLAEYIGYEPWKVEMWENPRLRDQGVLANKSHVEGLKILDESKGDMTEFFWSLKNFVGLENMRETLFHGILIDTLMLRKCYGKYVLPSMPPKEVRRGRPEFPGAVVFEPQEGIFRNVAVIDMSRYYPNIVISYKISPDKEGRIFPEICEELMAERDKIEKRMSKLHIDSPEYKALKKQQKKIKHLLSGMWGYVGWRGSRVYDLEKAELVARKAREGLLFLRERSRSLGYPVIYGDTDGVFIQVPSEMTGKLVAELNEALDEYCEKEGIEKNLKVKMDYYFSSVLFTETKTGGRAAKKRYAAWCTWESGKEVDYILVKGYEHIRRDASKITKKIQFETFDALLRRGVSGLSQFVKTTIKKMKSNEYSLSDIAISKTLHKHFKSYKSEPDFVRGSRWANKYLGFDIRAGDMVKMIYVKRAPRYPNTDVICFLNEQDLLEKIPDIIKWVDWEKVIDRTIKKKIENLIKLAGLSWDRIIGTKSLAEVFG